MRKGLTSLHRIGEKIYALAVWRSSPLLQHEDTIKVLLSAGANPNAQDAEGVTRLFTISSQHMETLTVAQLSYSKLAPIRTSRIRQGQTVLDVKVQGNSLQEISEQAARQGFAEKTYGANQSRVLRSNRLKFSLNYLDTLFGLVGEKLHELSQRAFTILKKSCSKNITSLGPLFGLVLFRTEAHDSGKRPPDCLPFARTRGSRTHFAVWRCSGQTHLATAPIVMYSEDLMPQARVIAKDLKRFLSLVLAVRRASILPEIELYPDRIKQVQANYQRVPVAHQELQQYSQRLRERFHLKQRRSPVSYIQSWRRKYPELEEWKPEHTTHITEIST